MLQRGGAATLVMPEGAESCEQSASALASAYYTVLQFTAADCQAASTPGQACTIQYKPKVQTAGCISCVLHPAMQVGSMQLTAACKLRHNPAKLSPLSMKQRGVQYMPTACSCILIDVVMTLVPHLLPHVRSLCNHPSDAWPDAWPQSPGLLLQSVPCTEHYALHCDCGIRSSTVQATSGSIHEPSVSLPSLYYPTCALPRALPLTACAPLFLLGKLVSAATLNPKP
jgi:hypothetical protein